VDKGASGSGEVFEIAGEASVSTDPSKGSLDDPALGLDDEALGRIRALDDLQASPAGAAGRLGGTRPLVAGIGEDGLDEGKRRRTCLVRTSAAPSRSWTLASWMIAASRSPL